MYEDKITKIYFSQKNIIVLLNRTTNVKQLQT